MSDLRREIAKIIDREHWRAVRGKAEGGDEVYVANHILALVHDAMMSDAAVEAGARAVTMDPDFGRNRWADDARNVLTAALDAVTEATE